MNRRITRALLCLIILVQSHPVWAKTISHSPKEIWIAARNDGAAGAGTRHNPYDGSNQPKLDAVMAAIPPNRTIHLGPGTFVTNGIVPKSGWRLYLTRATTIRMGVLPQVPAQKWSIFGAGCPDSFSNVHVEGGTWDCNLQNQTIAVAAQAIVLTAGGGNVTIKNVKVINWGSTYAGAESFVVAVFNVGPTGKIARNITFDGIEVTQPAAVTHLGTSSPIGAHGQDPSNPKVFSSGWLQNIEIKNCYVHDIDIPVMVASIQMGSRCRGVHIHHNRFENLGPINNTLCGCYLDTGASEDVLVEQNIFSGVVHSIYVGLTTHDPVRRWIIRNNRIQINRDYSAGGIELRGTNTTIQDVLIERNVISSVDGRTVNAFGIALGKVEGAIIRHNVIDNIKAGEGIVFEKGTSGIELFDNRQSDGTPVYAKP